MTGAEADPDRSAGLVSKTHNRTEPSSGREPPTASLTAWPDGSVVRVTRRVLVAGRQCRATKADGTRCQGRALKDSDVCAAHAGRKRSEVTTFSAASRRRMLFLLGRIRKDQPAMLVTLTWPTWAAPDAEEWHRSWDRFRVALTRAFEGVCAVWRREFTTAGVVHLHLLVYGVTYADLRAWVPSAWADCVDAPNRELRERVGTRVETVRAWHAVPRYIGKYVSKRDDVGADRAYGRWWGVLGKQNIPWAQPDREIIPDAVAMRLIRTARRFVAAEHRRRGVRRRGRAPMPVAGYTILTVDPSAWVRWANLLWVYEAFPD